MLNYDLITSHRPGPLDASYDERQCILYALGIGIGMDPLDREQIKFVHERELRAFPTMATTLGWMGRFTDPAFGIDAKMDKGAGKHAILQSARTLTASDGTTVATVESASIARGHGGFGGKVTATPEPHPTPDTPPDAVCDLPTPPNLALIFRLMGDENPLHIDPASAKSSGYEAPILHGAATFGIAAHAVLRTAAGYDPARLASIEARFSRPVFPGETIRTELWRDGADISFRCRVPARDEIVLTNGLARLR